MKQLHLLFLAIFGLFLASCAKEPLSMPIQDKEELSSFATKSILEAHETPYFDWENTSTVYIVNQGNILLPWISGADASIPSEILYDYHRQDGWELLYNLCSDSTLNVQGNKNYLIFYNKIRGILRVYIYNSNNTSTGSKDTYAHLTSNSSSRIWDFSQGIVSLNPDSSSNGTYIPNRTNNNPVTSSLIHGWNCFEAELAYDDSNASSHDTFGVSLVDLIHYDLQFKGILTGNATGNLIFPGTSSSGSLALQQYATAAKNTLSEIKTIIDSSKNMATGQSGTNTQGQTRVDAGTVITIASAGIGIIQNLFGLFDNSSSNESEATDNLTITLDTEIEGSGSIESATATVGIPSVSGLLLPGHTPNSSDIVIPHYNEKLGAWNIVNTPTVLLDSEYTPLIYEVLQGPPGYRTFGINRERYHSLGSVSIVINPEALACIDDYDYEVSYQYLYKYNGEYVGRELGQNYPYSGYCTPRKQYLKDCIYEEEMSSDEVQEYLSSFNALRQDYGLSSITEEEMTDEQKAKTIIFDVDSQYADRELNDPNTINFQISPYTQYSQALQIFNNEITYPSGDLFTNYRVKVKMIFHIKEEYGGGDYVSVKTYNPSVSARNINHVITTYYPYYMRPEEETETERWNHRWDWAQ